MKKLKLMILALVVIIGLHSYHLTTQAEEVAFPAAITEIFPDENVAEKIRAALGKTAITDSVTEAELATIKKLDLSTSSQTDPKAVKNIAGLEHLVNLEELTTGGSLVTDLSPISNLINMRKLTLAASAIVDLSPISGLTNIDDIYASYTAIEDVTPLKDLTKLETLTLFNTEVEDISVLSNLTALKSITIGAKVKDFSPLTQLNNLTNLNLRGNQLLDPSIFNGMTSVTKFYLTNQRITLDPVLLINGEVRMSNPIMNELQQFVAPATISDNGVYENDEFVWENIPANEAGVAFTFNTTVTLNGISVPFSGDVFIPLVTDTTAPIITADPEISYPQATVKTEAEFLSEIQASTDDGSVITSDFSTAVNFNIIGDYTVTLNAVDASGNQATPVQVVVHVIQDSIIEDPKEKPEVKPEDPTPPVVEENQEVATAPKAVEKETEPAALPKTAESTSSFATVAFGTILAGIGFLVLQRRKAFSK
ncbi:LapB repeat-containing protein [Isobaculum melis]|uniref:LPXTG-motif cell wall anchor domain-containing protein n=1 Tax=Isobaculum melis TaxID=142588 RepID=A0A1H9SDM3_9LACT|nr:LapB repeat-containing protein [Isobaculum melis]SER83008.1 LPXTG-motif cell wall anchor domain-containing protein [Isobaculum melis]